MPSERSLDLEYGAARRVLLDALEALGTHRKAVVLAGAQAIYEPLKGILCGRQFELTLWPHVTVVKRRSCAMMTKGDG